MSDLLFDGPAALAAKVRAREVSPRELVELSLRRIEALDPRLNSFRVVMAEEALAEADALEALDGPLAGVPVGIKDNFAVAGQAMTLGTSSHHRPADSDSEAVARLRAAGAIPVGITNVPELMIFPWTATDANGVTRNPWDLTRTPGGSSGGSAAAVAAGLVAAATASDGGGSIRIPAACCGLVGMKPSPGLVSGRGGSNDWLGLGVNGALARTVADSALLLEVLSGEPHVAAAGRAPGKLRIAVSRKPPFGFFAKLSDDQRRAWEGTSDLLAELGHEVVERDPAYGTVGLEFTQLWLRGIYEESREVPDPSTLERSTREMAALGRRLVPKRRREGLLSRRERTSERILALWDEVDVLLTPALARTAIDAEAAYGRPAVVAIERSSRFTPWSTPFNFTGQAACVVPAGFGDDGLPLSVQLVGRRGAEDLLYALAGQLESARPWAEYRPAIATDGGPPE